MTNIPTFDDLMNPTIQALNNLGGSATIHEIYAEVVNILQLPEDILNTLHNPEKSSQTEIEYRLAWSRTYLKKYGLLENSKRGVWTLTPEGRKTRKVNGQTIAKAVREGYQANPTNQETLKEAIEDEISETDAWREKLMTTLLIMSPDAFERLFQRLLRESGFSEVKVTGRTGDGGVDGKGIMQIGGLISFHVIFQCKRYKGSVAVSAIRDFRGAMDGRADKGIFVTTGNFTNDAIKEATREGATTIDLIDGDKLMDKLKELSLGVETKIIEVEEITIDEDWFLSI